MPVPNDSAKILTMVERVSRAKGWWNCADSDWHLTKSMSGLVYAFGERSEDSYTCQGMESLTALLWALLACLDDVEGEPARLLLDAHEDRNDARDRLTVLADHWAGGEVTTTVVVDVPEQDHVRIEHRSLAPMAAWIIAWLDGWRGETRETFGAEMMAAAKEVWERLTVVCPKAKWHEAQSWSDGRGWPPYGAECSTCDGHGRVPKHVQPEDPEWFGVIDDVEVTFTRRELMLLRVGDDIGNLARVDGIEHYTGLEPVQLSDEAQDIEGTQRVTVTLRSLRTGDTSELRAAWRL